jgi:hypothetical protein
MQRVSADIIRSAFKSAGTESPSVPALITIGRLNVRKLFVGMLAVLAATASLHASAEGCLKGAAVGGVVGHVAGKHGVVGAAAGCAVGHHEARLHFGRR